MKLYHLTLSNTTSLQQTDREMRKTRFSHNAIHLTTFAYSRFVKNHTYLAGETTWSWTFRPLLPWEVTRSPFLSHHFRFRSARCLTCCFITLFYHNSPCFSLSSPIILSPSPHPLPYPIIVTPFPPHFLHTHSQSAWEINSNKVNFTLRNKLQ